MYEESIDCVSLKPCKAIHVVVNFGYSHNDIMGNFMQPVKWG